MSFLKEHCSLFSVNEPKELEGFSCGDLDIDEFFALANAEISRDWKDIRTLYKFKGW